MAATIKPHTLKLTQGSLFLLEACLQDPGPCDTPAKTVEWGSTWKKVRAKSNHLITLADGATHDITKPVHRDEKETDLAFQKRGEAFQEAVKTWQATPITLQVSDRMRDCFREAVKWTLGHQTDRDKPARVRVEINEYWQELISALGLVESKDLPAEDDDLEVA